MSERTAATHRLAAVLAAENAALQRMDLAAAAAMLAEKEAALAAFQAAQKAQRAEPVAQASAEALREAVTQNQRLLERAISVQTRVLGIIAQAARATNPVQRYGRSGAYAARPVSGWALSARA